MSPFTGAAPLFMRQNLILFPGVPWIGAVGSRQDVHTIAEGLLGGGWLAVAGQPGAAAVCLARIRQLHPMPNGGLIVSLLGITRAFPRHSRNRWMDLRIPPRERTSAIPPAGWLREAFQIIQRLRGFPMGKPDPFPPDLWLDLLGHLLPLPAEVKQQLLSEPSQIGRFEILRRANPGPAISLQRFYPRVSSLN